MNLKLPKGWEEVYTDQFIEIKKLDDGESSFFIKQIEILAILTDTLPEDDMWNDLDVEELSQSIKELKWLYSEPSKNFKKQIGDLHCIDINQITFGQFIDLNHFFSDNYLDNIYLTCAILYRKQKINEWGTITYEPYDLINIFERSELFKDLPITDIYGVLDYYISFKDKITNIYKGLFSPKFDENEFTDEDYTEEEKKDIEEEEKLSQWSWNNVVHKLSDGDFTKHNQIYNMNFVSILNHLTYLNVMKL